MSDEVPCYELVDEAAQQALNTRSQGVAEGVRTFLEKREPHSRGA